MEGISLYPMLSLWSDGSSSQKRKRRKEDSHSHLALPFCTAKSRQGRRDLVPSQVWQDLQARLPSWSSSSEWDSAGEGTEKVTLGNCFLCKNLCPHLPSPMRWPNMLLIGQKMFSLVLSMLLCPPARFTMYIKHHSVTGELKEALGRLTLLIDSKPLFPNTFFYILYPEFSCVHYFL